MAANYDPFSIKEIIEDESAIRNKMERIKKYEAV